MKNKDTVYAVCKNCEILEFHISLESGLDSVEKKNSDSIYRPNDVFAVTTSIPRHYLWEYESGTITKNENRIVLNNNYLLEVDLPEWLTFE